MTAVQLKLKDVQGEVVGNIEVSDDVFGAPVNTALVHQVMVGQLANARQGTASTKRGAGCPEAEPSLGPRNIPAAHGWGLFALPRREAEG